MDHHTLDLANYSESDSETETSSDSEAPVAVARQITAMWSGYLETELSIELTKNPTHPDAAEPLWRKYKLSHRGYSKYYAQATFRLDINNKLTKDLIINSVVSCCCSGVIINGVSNTLDYNSVYYNPPHHTESSPYRSIMFCRECLSPMENQYVTECLRKPGIMHCIDYVYSGRAMNTPVSPVILYTDAVGVCETCAMNRLGHSDSPE